MPRINQRPPNGFTVIEILVVVGIITLVSVISLATLVGRRSRAELDSTTKQIIALLREAQSRSASQEDGTVWGVHLENSSSTTPFYALFHTSYSATNTVSHNRLPSSVRYASSSIAWGSSIDITFAQISGEPLASTSIALELSPGGGGGSAPERVDRDSSGKIFFDDFNRSNL